MRRIVLVVFALGLALLLSGCAGTPAASSFQSSPTSTSLSNGITTPTTTPTTPPSIVITPRSATLGATQSQKFAATLSTGAAATVDWTVGDCMADCGSITPDGTYTAPPSVAKDTWVTIYATLRDDKRVTGNVGVNLRAVSVVVAPGGPVRLATNAALPFAATVRYDSLDRGVVWSLSGPGCSGDGCGTLSNASATSVVYQAPASTPDPPAVLLKATSVTEGARSGLAGVIVSASSSQSQLLGKYAFLIHGTGGGGNIAMVGHIDIDANGDFNGIWDATLHASGGISEPISGHCVLGVDGNGTFRIESGSGIWSFAIAAQSGGNVAALAPDSANGPPLSDVAVEGGYLLRQDPNAFSMSSVAGDRVLGLTFMNVGAIGRFTADTAGTVSGGIMDLTWSGCCMNFFTTSTVTGAFSAPDPITGRGTAALTVTPGPDAGVETFHFAYYIASDKKMLLVQNDANTWLLPVLRGEARAQRGGSAFTNASLSGPVIFSLSSKDAGWYWTPMAALGQVRPDGAGTLSVTSDENQATVEDSSQTITLEATRSGTYSVAANGRVEMNLPGVAKNLYLPHIAVAYLTESNSGYLIREEVFGTPFGYFEPQTVASFTPASMSGTYWAYQAGPPRTFEAEKDVGFIALGADGSASAFLGIDRGAGNETFHWTGTYSLGENGRCVMTLSDGLNQKTIVLWAVSANRAIAIVTVSPGDAVPSLVELRR